MASHYLTPLPPVSPFCWDTLPLELLSHYFRLMDNADSLILLLTAECCDLGDHYGRVESGFVGRSGILGLRAASVYYQLECFS